VFFVVNGRNVLTIIQMSDTLKPQFWKQGEIWSVSRRF